MRKIFLFILSLASISGTAQTFEVDTIFKNGPLHERINLVFLGDGYQAHELTEYVEDVNAILDEIFNQSPFKEYKPYFNAFAIKVISNQSGAIHPQNSSDGDCPDVPVAAPDNYFGSKFDVGGIHRLLVPTKSGLIANVLADNLPQYDQVFVVVNSTYYGGSGGFYATGSVHPSGKEVAIHEIGHSFAHLADEYWAGPQYAAEQPNMTQQSSASLVKWKQWLSVGGVGIYSHEESTSWKRPHQSCKMRYLNNPFCKVCSETFVETFHALVEPFADYSPTETTMPVPEDGTIEFSLSLIKPEPNTLKITWQKNYAVIAKNQESISLEASSFGEGAKIRATVIDTTQLTRSTNHQTTHMYIVEWTVGEVVTDVPISVVERDLVVSVFPNPATTEITISYLLDKPTAVTISLLDAIGRKHKTLIRQDQQAGEHQVTFESDEFMKHPGEYLLQFNFDNAILVRKLVKQ